MLMLNKLSDNPEYNPVLIKTNNAEKTELKKRSPADGQKKPLTTPWLANYAKAVKVTEPNKPVSNKKFLPGWLYIRKKNAKIQYYYDEIYSNRYPCGDTYIDQELKMSNIILKYRLAREQYERDNDVVRLGDLSDYYNANTMQEMFEEEDFNMLTAEYMSSDLD